MRHLTILAPLTYSTVATVTILDDYQNVALTSTDWSPVRSQYDIETINEHIADEAELVQRLASSEVIVAMRERTSFPPACWGNCPPCACSSRPA
jgi:hypothetical protein